MTLLDSEKEALLNLAREAIEESIDPHSNSFFPVASLTDPLHTKCGAFVSLYVKDDLRGCIGSFSEEEAMYRKVKSMAVSAATTDTRFKPILPEELGSLCIEISVLSPRSLIKDISEIEIGKHGIFMTRGANRGTLLPQVAVTQNWTVEELLGNCARYKAGIGWDGWKTAELYTYEALIFRSPPPLQDC